MWEKAVRMKQHLAASLLGIALVFIFNQRRQSSM